MSREKIDSRKLGLTVLLLSLVLVICVTPAAAEAFITTTHCPASVTQGDLFTISGNAPGISTLKLTLSKLPAQTRETVTFYTTVNSDESFSFSLDAARLIPGHYQALITAETYNPGNKSTIHSTTVESFTVNSHSETPSKGNTYSMPSLTASIDNTAVEQGTPVTISIETTGTSDIEYMLIGQSSFNYKYIDTPEKSTILEISTSTLPLGEYTAYIIHPNDYFYDVQADKYGSILFKGYRGSSFGDLHGTSGENKIDAYLQQSNDLYKKFKFTVCEKGTVKSAQDQTGIIVLIVILGVVVIGGLVGWFVHKTLKQNGLQKNTSATNEITKDESVTKRNGINNPTKRYCSNCGTEIDDEAVFCKKCGTNIEQTKAKAKYCSNCGTEIDNDAVFCKKCGKKL